MDETDIELPAEPHKAFAYLVSQCATGLALELIEDGKSEVQARNAVIHYLLDMAAGEACRQARREDREPDPEKWRVSTADAFDRAVKRTTASADCDDKP